MKGTRMLVFLDKSVIVWFWIGVQDGRQIFVLSLTQKNVEDNVQIIQLYTLLLSVFLKIT